MKKFITIAALALCLPGCAFVKGLFSKDNTKALGDCTEKCVTEAQSVSAKDCVLDCLKAFSDKKAE